MRYRRRRGRSCVIGSHIVTRVQIRRYLLCPSPGGASTAVHRCCRSSPPVSFLPLTLPPFPSLRHPNFRGDQQQIQILPPFRVPQKMADLLRAVEERLSRHVLRLASVLHASGKHLESSGTTSALCRAHESAAEAYASLSDALFGALAAFCIFVCAAFFVFGMPFFADWYFGFAPTLPPVPYPSRTRPADDASALHFTKADSEPLLASPFADAIEARSPSTSESLGWLRCDTAATVSSKIGRARAAQAVQTSFAQRRTFLDTLSRYILDEQEDLCTVSLADTGKTMLDASLGEILTTLEKLRWVAAEGETFLRPERRSTGPATIHKTAYVEYEPLGVIGAIAPWNYPMHNLFNPVISAVFAGNAVVVKPSEHTVFSSVYYARIIRRALALCELSPELVQVVVGGPEVGEALVGGDIDKLFFTGSTGVGKKVACAAAERLLPVVLELGGKDPFIICDDADVAHATDLCMRGVLQNAGQNCIGVERVYVHDKVMDEVIERFLKSAGAVRLGVDMGAITMGPPAIERLEALVADAVQRGATLVVGGHGKGGTGIYADGAFFEATVLTGVKASMRIAQEEVFGPIVAVYAWRHDVELVQAVNGSKFGLGASVFTKNAKRGDKIFASLKVGMGSVNDYGVHYLCQSLPFGGTKESGSDRFAGIEGLRGCCLAKSVVRDRFPGIKTKLPANFKYPIYDNAFNLSAELNEMMYRPVGISKFDNIRNILLMLTSRTSKPRSIGSQ